MSGRVIAGAAVALLLACAAPRPVLRAQSDTVAIVGGTVYPVSAPKIERGTVVIRDGRIVAVGANVAVPADAQRIAPFSASTRSVRSHVKRVFSPAPLVTVCGVRPKWP